MKTKFFVVTLILSIILFSGSLIPDDNQEKIMWGDEKYCLEFKYLTEKQPILKDLWEELKAEEQKNKINDVKEPARDRYNEVKEYYDLMMSKWDIEETEKYLNSITDESIELVRLWLGEKEALQLKKKKDTLKYLVEEAKISDIDKIDFKILEKYFKPEVISNIKGIKIEEEQKNNILNKGDNRFFKEVKKLSKKKLDFNELAHTYDGANLKGGAELEADKLNQNISDGKIVLLKNNYGPNTIKSIEPPSMDKDILSGKHFLTKDEIALVKEVFGDKIDYSKVKIITGKDMTLWGKILTSRGAAVTWGNTIYFPNNNKGETEYNFNDLEGKEWLIHEMTHVYQYQKSGWGYALKSAGEQITKGKDAYNYDKDLSADKDFSDYGIEQQAVMVEDYFRYLMGEKEGRNGNTFTPEKIKIIKEILNKEGLYKKENKYESNKTK